jgi:hypothetical protein
MIKTENKFEVKKRRRGYDSSRVRQELRSGDMKLYESTEIFMMWM